MGESHTPGRRPLFWAALLAFATGLCALALEGVALAWYAMREGQLFYTHERLARGGEPEESVDPDTARLVHQIHPYFGFAVRPGIPIRRFVASAVARRLERTPGPASDWLELRSNNLGFYSDGDYPTSGDGDFVVGVFGGSVAHSFAMRAGPLLAQRLAALPLAGEREVAVLNFASGGYKQPQQTLILAYILTLGQPLDLVVNIDGFNEIALGAINAARGLEPWFPSSQIMDDLQALAQPEANLAAIRRLAELAALRESIEALERSPGGALAVSHLLAELRLRRLRAREAALAEPARGVRNASSRLFFRPRRSGPFDPAHIVDEWGRASTLMAALSASTGARYLHVLQPNQYASERRFGPAERRVALNHRSPYARHTPGAYPLLRARGAALRESGIEFHDASAIFDSVADPIYVDSCCHYNQLGYEMLAEFIADRVSHDHLVAVPDEDEVEWIAPAPPIL